MDPCVRYGRSTWFFRILHQQQQCQLGLKGTERRLIERRLWVPGSIIRKQAEKTTRLAAHVTFMKKEGWLPGWSFGPKMWSCDPQRIILRASILFFFFLGLQFLLMLPDRILKFRGIADSFLFFCVLRFWMGCRIVAVSFLFFCVLPFPCPSHSGMSMFAVKWLSHHCSWEADNFFSSFPGPQVEKRFAPDGIYPESHSYLIYNMWFK